MLRLFISLRETYFGSYLDLLILNGKRNRLFSMYINIIFFFFYFLIFMIAVVLLNLRIFLVFSIHVLWFYNYHCELFLLLLLFGKSSLPFCCFSCTSFSGCVKCFVICISLTFSKRLSDSSTFMSFYCYFSSFVLVILHVILSNEY